MKRRLAIAAVPALLAATPASATSSIHCDAGEGGPELWIGVGNDRATGIFQVRIVEGREEIVTGTTRGAPRIVRGNLNRRRLSLDVAPGGARGILLALNTTRRGTPYVGSLVFRGRAWRVRCFWDEDDPG